MKSSKNTPSPKGRTTVKAAAIPKTPARSKTKRAKVVTLDTYPPHDQIMPQAAHSPSEVALRAYHNFQKRGSADGGHTDDWLCAETELTNERRLARA